MNGPVRNRCPNCRYFFFSFFFFFFYVFFYTLVREG
jgi:hypothetical protein